MTTRPVCIIVMGPYRSGTSLVSQVLYGLGVDFGDLSAFQLEADRYNPGGYFQRLDVVRANVRLIGNVSESIAAPASPEMILQDASPAMLADVDLSWLGRSQLSGLKDPRFCATLLTWIRMGLLNEDSMRLVRVTRNPETIARSSILQREVGSFCGYDLARAETMARSYDAHAAWHMANLAVPSIEVPYEQLVKSPGRMVAELSLFIGQDDPKMIRRGLAAIGKRRALVRHYINKLIHPRKALATARKTLGAWSGKT